LAAGRALSACLSVLKERTYHLQWYCYLYDQLLEGFECGDEEHVHGSMLVLAEAFCYTGDFLLPRFKEMCKCLLQPKLKVRNLSLKLESSISYAILIQSVVFSVYILQ
jgi:FKBP12-rapamycin complex-associated protein